MANLGLRPELLSEAGRDIKIQVKSLFCTYVALLWIIDIWIDPAFKDILLTAQVDQRYM